MAIKKGSQNQIDSATPSRFRWFTKMNRSLCIFNNGQLLNWMCLIGCDLIGLPLACFRAASSFGLLSVDFAAITRSQRTPSESVNGF